MLAKPSQPLRRSVWLVASHARAPAGTGIIALPSSPDQGGNDAAAQHGGIDVSPRAQPVTTGQVDLDPPLRC